ncbi:ubiquitin carboxyl-terminal hydrolase 50-like [Eucyclogobius newberryi]|uniref:ubiquitin carboxyl-terminal hydrolase 50-like n=1 Tax=Eucyclogobius newberryi TaxID=166745 RepID=UPI003B5B4606
MARTDDIAKILDIADVYEQRDAAEYFEIILRKTTPEASKIFKGELNHMTTCCRCNTRNNAPGFFWIIPLSIGDPHQTYRVNKGIEDFFNKEKVSGENKIYCAECDQKQDAFVMYEMKQSPEVLTLLLKRFHYISDLKCNVKVNCEAEVPLTLTIQDNTYKLYAMVKHYGNLTGGHYIAYIFSSQTKEWYDFNDERVKLRKNKYMSGKPYLRSCSSYLLMYMKKSGNPENLSENKEETPDADETHVTWINEQTETRPNRERESHVQDFNMAHVNTFGQSKSQPNSPLLYSSRKGNHTEPDSSKLHRRASVKPVSALDSQKSVRQRGGDRYTPKTGKRPLKSSKCEKSSPWKY